MTRTKDVLPEKTLFDVLHDVWRAKIYILGSCGIMLMLSFVFMGMAQDYYRAEMILAPAIPMGQGMSTGSQRPEGTIQIQNDDLQSSAAFLRFQTIYDGVSVASILMQDKNILAALTFDRPFEFSKARNKWSAESLSEYLSNRVVLESVSGTPLRRLVYLHPNKDFAAAMVARVHRISDEMIRVRLLREANGRIDYLNDSLSRVQNPDHRRSLAALLMEQERLKMLVSLDQPFAASIVEPPSVSSRPHWPDPYVVYPVFLLVGFLMGFVVYGLRHHEG